MPYFSVLLNGQGISIDSDSPGEAIVGFWTTRWVEASDPNHASEKASDLVLKDWTSGDYAEMNRGDVPKITADEVCELGRLKYWFRCEPRGHSFYTSEE